MIGPYAKTTAQFDVEWKFDDGGSALETPDKFGEIVYDADRVNIEIGEQRGGPWAIVLHYLDDEGRAYTTKYAARLDMVTRLLDLKFSV